MPIDKTLKVKSGAIKPDIVAESCFITAISQAFSASRGAMFLVVELAEAADVAGLAAFVLFSAAAGEVAGDAALAGSAFFSAVAAGSVDSIGFAAGVSSTVAEAFSSVAGAVDSAGEADSSCAKVIPTAKVNAKNGTRIFMECFLVGQTRPRRVCG